MSFRFFFEETARNNRRSFVIESSCSERETAVETVEQDLSIIREVFAIYVGQTEDRNSTPRIIAYFLNETGNVRQLVHPHAHAAYIRPCASTQ